MFLNVTNQFKYLSKNNLEIFCNSYDMANLFDKFELNAKKSQLETKCTDDTEERKGKHPLMLAVTSHESKPL